VLQDEGLLQAGAVLPATTTSTLIQPSQICNVVPTKWAPGHSPLPEELEKPIQSNDRFDANGLPFYASRDCDGSHAAPQEQRGHQQKEKQRSPPNSTPTQQVSMKSASNPSLAHVSEGSLKEYFLRNINSDFCHDAPLLIEEKLKTLFSKFILELSGTLDSFPGTFLESCVLKLSSTINSSVQEIITAEVIPALYDKFVKHLSECPLPPNRNEKLQEFLNDKLDSLQDIIIGLNADKMSACYYIDRANLTKVT
jgi:hypothetical protein